MKVGSLFSGIGGIDLGLQWAGMETIWFVEYDKYCQKVLAKHWPGVPCHGDIKTVDFRSLPRPDLLCGGFPCQPVSLAGKCLAEKDVRWLWPEMFNAIRILRPKYTLLENVPGLLNRGMSSVLCDLASIGYDAEWETISAYSFGSPQIRKRIFIVAYPQRTCNDQSMEERRVFSKWENKKKFREKDWFKFIMDPDEMAPSKFIPKGEFTAQPNLIRGDNGIPNIMDRLKCLGNAVVPQVVHWIGERILEADKSLL